MHQYIKSLIAAAILFLSLITSVALSYAITPTSEIKSPTSALSIKLNIDNKKIQFNFNQSLNLLLPRVKD